MDSTQSEVSGTRVERSRRVELIAAVLTFLVGLGAIGGASAWRHRSGGSTLLGEARRSLLPDAPTKSLGDVAPDGEATVAYTLRNLTGHPIRLQGAQTSCACPVVEGIPCSIAVGEAREVRGIVHAPKERGRVEGSFVLYTDDDLEPEVRLGYSGRVVDAGQH